MFLKLAEEELLHRRILNDEFYYLSNRGGIWFWQIRRSLLYHATRFQGE